MPSQYDDIIIECIKFKGVSKIFTLESIKTHTHTPLLLVICIPFKLVHFRVYSQCPVFIQLLEVLLEFGFWNQVQDSRFFAR
jgi:hypothetical protein